MFVFVAACFGVFGDRQGYARKIHDKGGYGIYSLCTQKYPGAQTVHSYAKSHGYHYIVDTYCSLYTNIHYCKQSRVLHHLQQNTNLQWMAVIDCDTMIVDKSLSLEMYTRTSADVVMYERFHTGEVAAGIYLIRNTGWAHEFLEKWVAMPQGPNADNGALQSLLANGKCQWPPAMRGPWLDAYFRYVSVCKKAMNITDCGTNGKPHYVLHGHVQILRRGHLAIDVGRVQGHIPYVLIKHGVKAQADVSKAVQEGNTYHMNIAEADRKALQHPWGRIAFSHCTQ